MYYGVGNNAYWQNIGYYGGTLHGWASHPLVDPPLFSNGNNLSFAGGPAGSYNFVYTDTGAGYQSWAITQTIGGLVSGDKYTLTFLANFFTENNPAGDTARWNVNLGGSLNAFTTNPVSHQGSYYAGFTGGDTVSTPATAVPQGAGGYGVANGTGWVEETLTLTASGATQALTFIGTGEGDPPFAAITDISLTAASGTPEPATWFMLLTGFGCLGAILRRRRALRPAATAA
jgi:hypothetical protein